MVDFAMRCPVALKVRDLSDSQRIDENVEGDKQERYFARTKKGKSIMRDVMADIMPDEVTSASKQGFSSPDASWFRGESSEFVHRRLRNSSSRIWEYLDFATAQALLDEHQSGTVNRRLLVWSLLSVDSLLSQQL
jgi:asparagine synthase (glutamine-hydrolysing)